MAKNGTPPPDVERVIERHVRIHAQQAVKNLENALAPLQERTVYRGSPTYRALTFALGAARDAERKVAAWNIRTAPQGDLLAPQEDGRVAQAEADTPAAFADTPAASMAAMRGEAEPLPPRDRAACATAAAHIGAILDAALEEIATDVGDES